MSLQTGRPFVSLPTESGQNGIDFRVALLQNFHVAAAV
jgi:hypothetical protein